MKQSMIQAPSRNDILFWINSCVQDKIGNVKKIEQLGNGSAYLHLLAHLRPGIIKIDKIIKNPTNNHEIISNLKMLTIAFQKMKINYNLEIEKISQMKYQDNFHLALFLYKFMRNNENVELVNRVDPKEDMTKSGKYKLLPGKSITRMSHQKQPLPEITKEEFVQITRSAQKIKQIREIVNEQKPNQQKLNKIASLLDLAKNRTVKAESLSSNLPSSTPTTSINKYLGENMYKFAKNNQILNSEASKEMKRQNKTTDKQDTPSFLSIPMQQYVDQQLLSQKKQEYRPEIKDNEIQLASSTPIVFQTSSNKKPLTKVSQNENQDN